MKRYKGIRYAFRPRSYWDDDTVEQAILRNVKGTRRREALSQALAAGQLDAVPEELQSDEVSDTTRAALGRIHPSFMGGEYLPSYFRDETEMVRIRLQSTTSDVISIHARREEEVIRYRVVDEYATRFMYDPPEQTRPFSLGELIVFLDGIRVLGLYGPFSLAYNELNREFYDSPDSLRHFTSISSNLYPQLSDHFERVFEDWVRAERRGF